MWRQKDVLGGLFFTLLGTGAFLVARDYQPGTLLNMGPGYMPRLVAGGMAGLGLLQLLLAVARGPVEGGEIGEINLRALVLILTAIIAFGLLIVPAGIIPAVSVMILIAWFADPMRKARHLPLILLFANLLPILIFNYGLKMQLRIWGLF